MFLQRHKILTKILVKYFDYIDIFLFNIAIKLLEYIRINKYVIILIKKINFSIILFIF